MVETITFLGIYFDRPPPSPRAARLVRLGAQQRAAALHRGAERGADVGPGHPRSRHGAGGSEAWSLSWGMGSRNKEKTVVAGLLGGFY